MTLNDAKTFARILNKKGKCHEMGIIKKSGLKGLLICYKNDLQLGIVFSDGTFYEVFFSESFYCQMDHFNNLLTMALL